MKYSRGQVMEIIQWKYGNKIWIKEVSGSGWVDDFMDEESMVELRCL